MPKRQRRHCGYVANVDCGMTGFDKALDKFRLTEMRRKLHKESGW